MTIKNFICLLIFLSLLEGVYGQLTSLGKPRLLTKKEIKDDKVNKNCFYLKRYTAKERLQFYPFNKAATIKLISFDNNDSSMFGGKLPLKNGGVDFERLREEETITQLQTDTLTDILYNWGYGGPFYSFSDPCCYNPRNAILFMDSSNKIIAFLEICFKCQHFRISSKKIKTGDFCNQKYELIRKFFLTCGIKWGTLTKEGLDLED